MSECKSFKAVHTNGKEALEVQKIVCGEKRTDGEWNQNVVAEKQ